MSSTGTSKSNTKAPSEQELSIMANRLRNELKSIASKIGELELELDEHNLVIKTMSPMNSDRKCFRLINGVLVERTVNEVLPALKTNQDGIQNTIKMLTEQYKTKDKEFSEFQKKHNIRVAAA